MASGSKGREQQANAFQAATQQAKANGAIDAAALPDPLETRRRARALAFDKWESGESGPVDVRNMPGHDVAISLYNDAKASRDAGRVSRGIGANMQNANPNFLASLEKENQLERDINASGQLENYVDSSIADNKAELTGLYTTANARRAASAQMYQNSANAASGNYFSYLQYLNSRPPSFLRQLALAGAGQAGGLASAFMGGGGGGGGGAGAGAGVAALGLGA